jgi:hypothetical protein
MNKYLIDFFLTLITPAGIAGIVRTALGALFGWLVSQGWLDPGELEKFIAVLVAGLVPILWSVLQKMRSGKVLTAALELPPGATKLEAEDLADLKDKQGI